MKITKNNNNKTFISRINHNKNINTSINNINLNKKNNPNAKITKTIITKKKYYPKKKNKNKK